MRMSSCADSSSKGSHVSQADVLPTGADLDEWRKSPAKGEEDEDEDEDVDFNPFLKETPSPDASSSLSSEIEGIDGDVVENGVKPSQTAEIYLSELTDEGQSFAVEDSEHCEGGNFVLNSPKLVCEQELPELVAGTLSKTDSEILSQAENGNLQGKEDHTSSRPDSHSDVVVEATNSWKAVMHSDEEDAICKRTRARYSLVRFTLDELESFLQETDDDEDIQNVDDEEEYKKFLAAVLIGGDGNGHPTPDTGNVDDEDEDNDADFEIELEEALESDLDDRPSDKITKGNFEPSRRRPETRQNRRKDTSAECKKKLLQHGKRPLRPLLPLVPVGSTPYLPASSGQPSMTDAPLNYASLTANAGCMNGFAPNQIGQLYCLIHEHVQLLIQIYSLCILDPSRQNIASQVEELILQMLHKRDQIVARRSIPYPGICFSPAYVCSSTSEGSKASNMAQQTLGCASTLDAEGVTSSVDNQMLATLNGSQGQGQGEYAGSLAVFSRAMEGSVWLPHISGPVLSVLDVAPLNLVKKYIDDLRIVREQRRWHVESTCDIRSEREPLFPTSSSLSAVEGDIQVLSGVSSSNARSGSPSSGHHPLKRSLAAAIVESAKKQSVALVQKDVAKLAQIFFPLFNQALLPHKPPPSAVANRVLFTDAEDELLALGIMEFNTDWKAIQQRFLPCKSKHQIFVRQKNRCSSKAPENPIKAVRRMKTSPLTAEEVQYIQEGFKIYKLDWMSVCKFIVPHRDPSLLPRQWRVALGTQKSYKQNPTKKEKRRAYEAERRRRRGANPASWQNASEKEDYQVEHAGGENSCEDDCIDDPEEPYVHEGFLVDWRPSFKQPHSYVGKGGIHGISEEAAYETQHHAGSMHQFPIASTFQNTYSASRVIHNNVHGTSVPVHPVSETSLWTAKSPFGPLSHRGRQTDSARLVKLAPNLPPVNLPQNVRVISQSAYLSCDGAASTITGSADNRPCHAAKVGDTPAAQQSKSMSLNDSVAHLPREESRAFKEKTVNEERGIDSDSQMHPLLFQVPEDGGLPYYPSNCNTLAPAPLSFFSGSQPQLNLSLFHNPQQLNNDRSFRPRDSASNVRGSGIDFHPLLQGTEEVNGDLTSASSKAHQSVSVAVQAKVPASGASLTTGTDLSCCADRVSELDLDIHLSSSSSLGKTIGKNTGATHKLMTPIRHSAKSGTLLNSQQASNPFDQQHENLSSVRSDLISGSQMLSRQNDVVQSNMDLAGDESHPGIIMEQEELSDSDEDIEEHVEFECEEMADSEGEEESSMEIVADTNNKEVQNHAAEKVSMELREDHRHESRNGHCLKSNDSTPGNSSLPSLKLALTCEGRDTASKSWLSLDPRLRGCPPNPAGETQARKLRSPRPNRSCKKTKTCIRNNTEQVHDQTMEAAKQVDLGTSTVPNRRPRKRTCRSNANSEVGIAMKSG